MIAKWLDAWLSTIAHGCLTGSDQRSRQTVSDSPLATSWWYRFVVHPSSHHVPVGACHHLMCCWSWRCGGRGPCAASPVRASEHTDEAVTTRYVRRFSCPLRLTRVVPCVGYAGITGPTWFDLLGDVRGLRGPLLFFMSEGNRMVNRRPHENEMARRIRDDTF